MKKYITPTVEVSHLHTQSMLSSSLVIGTGTVSGTQALTKIDIWNEENDTDEE